MSIPHTVTRPQLDDLIRRGTERQPHLEARLRRAADLVQAGAAVEGADGWWSVESTQPGVRHLVEAGGRSCTCADYCYRKVHCAHRLAVLMITRAEAEQAAADRHPAALAYIAC
jgi:hypothetical protein